jgi:hypothetical protein
VRIQSPGQTGKHSSDNKCQHFIFGGINPHQFWSCFILANW